jgi:hypothetical protein
MFPLYEAVVNSIHSIEEGAIASGFINIYISRETVLSLVVPEARRGAPSVAPITGFCITDNGVGFTDKNMESFETLDSEYKANKGCRGVGRLLWLKAFDVVEIDSVYKGNDDAFQRRTFTFSPAIGVNSKQSIPVEGAFQRETKVTLDGFDKQYRDRAPKTTRAIANSLLEHCLWYFVRDGGAPSIKIMDADETISLDELYDEYMFSSAKRERLEIKGHEFELTHIKLKASLSKSHFIAWCAAGRVVEEEIISGKLPGLYGRISSEGEEFVYACYVTSDYLDEHVRPERSSFDISDDLFSKINFDELRRRVFDSSAAYLDGYLQESRRAARARVEEFVRHTAPRYRPILPRISEDKLSVDPLISDKDLDLVLHKHLTEIEGELLAEGHDLMGYGRENPDSYRRRLQQYLQKADDIKKSDLASYVFHRKVVLDILEQVVKKGVDGTYAREEIIHELIMPMRKTSDEVRMDSCNLWLIDERLAFHDFLASDKPISSMPIVDSLDAKEPDICALNVFDEPILVSDRTTVPLASIVIVELKRPMRNDAAPGEEKDPVEQAFGYLERIRNGRAQTAAGRPIPRSEDIPGFCYAVCDLTPTVVRRCKTLGLNPTSDGLGYFGYNPNYKAYVEVISFDGLLNSAKQRNRAFFDKLGLPTA